MLKKNQAARLHPSNPHAALRAPVRKPRPAQRAEPLRLTDEQRKNPLIRSALPRLQGISSTYRGKYLRGLDTIHGGRRTRLEVFQALELVAESMLVRLDWATGVVGYFDMDDGRFVLNTQCNVAEDAGITPQRMSRFIGKLAAAGYAYQRSERIRLDEITPGRGLEHWWWLPGRSPGTCLGWAQARSHCAQWLQCQTYRYLCRGVGKESEASDQGLAGRDARGALADTNPEQ